VSQPSLKRAYITFRNTSREFVPLTVMHRLKIEQKPLLCI